MVLHLQLKIKTYKQLADEITAKKLRMNASIEQVGSDSFRLVCKKWRFWNSE